MVNLLQLMCSSIKYVVERIVFLEIEFRIKNEYLFCVEVEKFWKKNRQIEMGA